MVESPRDGRRIATIVQKLTPASPLSLMLVCALAPSGFLCLIRYVPPGPPARAMLMVAMPLACFLLTVLLCQAHQKIAVLERDQAVAIGRGGIDPLTGLPDRVWFDDILAKALGVSTVDATVALIAIDIDRFKSVNDTYGHQAGDRLLVGIAERIRRVVRDGDCLARLSGDEFAIILPQVDSAATCAATAHRILDAMTAPFDLVSTQFYATLSLGIAIGPKDGQCAPTLRQAADLALYRAKHEGRNRCAFFDETMEQKLHLGQTIEDDLRRAIGDDALEIAYQPLIRTENGLMQGVEALVRWEHPTLGPIPPEDFIPLAESRGLIVSLGEWVLRRACLDARRWPGLRIAVNVSPVQFRQRGFVDRVAAILADTGFPPTRLDLELTEGVLIQDAEQAEEVIVRLRAIGIRIGLDDFGSGYSSMIYLRRFAVDKVKVDRAFLQSVEPRGEGAIILESIVSLGHALGLSVTAEGVEHSEQVEFLRKLGCDELQGFYFSPPLPAEGIDERLTLAAWSTAPTIAPQRLIEPRAA